MILGREYRILRLIGIITLAATSAAGESPDCLDRVRFEGHRLPGGYLRVVPPPSARVFHGADRLTPRDGVVLIPFPHDAKGEVSIRIECDGMDRRWRWTLPPRPYAVQRLRLPEKQVTPPRRWWQRIRREAEQMANARRRSDVFAEVPPLRFQPPTHGVFTGNYGARRILNGQEKRPHLGLDIAAPKGTPVVAPAPGIVVLTADMFYNGKTVVLQHGGGLNSVYAHLDRIDVVDGQSVDAGEPIGNVGSTGRSTGPHLHWGISLDTTPLDPQLFLRTPEIFDSSLGH